MNALNSIKNKVKMNQNKTLLTCPNSKSTSQGKNKIFLDSVMIEKSP
jgi:hypothetical protein